MPSQILYEFMNYGSLALVVAAIAVGVVLTKTAVRKLLAAALVGAAVVGARTIRAKDAALAALTDEPTDTWRQPESSPDPRLLAD